MGRKPKIQHCRNFAPSTEEINYLINNTETFRYKVMLILLWHNMREGEVAHMQSSWVHINDAKSKHEGANYINIPNQSILCSCWDCTLQWFLEFQQHRHTKKHSSKWFQKKQKKFYRLKEEFNENIKELIKKKIKAHPEKKISDKWFNQKLFKFFDDKGYNDKKFITLDEYQWRPKTKAGARYIWLLDDEQANFIKEFFETNKTIGMNRRQIYARVKKLGLKYLKKKLFPHAIRSASAIKLAYSGISEASVNTMMGWETNQAKSYVNSNSKLALVDLKNKMKNQ